MSVTIKTADPEMALAISEGANAVALQRVSAEYAHLQAVNGVRVYGDSVRWEDVRGALAVKYSIRRHGRLYGAVWGLIGGLVLAVDGWYRYFADWNREA